MNRKEIKKRDDEWKNLVKKRDNWTCVFCGKHANLNINKRLMHAHHIIPRTFREFRWELWNGLTLCYSHHMENKFSPHKNPIWFALWLQKNLPEIHQKVVENTKKLENSEFFHRK